MTDARLLALATAPKRRRDWTGRVVVTLGDCTRRWVRVAEESPGVWVMRWRRCFAGTIAKRIDGRDVAALAAVLFNTKPFRVECVGALPRRRKAIAAAEERLAGLRVEET